MVAVLVSTMPNPNNHFDGINYLQMCILYLQYMRVSCVHRNYQKNVQRCRIRKLLCANMTLYERCQGSNLHLTMGYYYRDSHWPHQWMTFCFPDVWLRLLAKRSGLTVTAQPQAQTTPVPSLHTQLTLARNMLEEGEINLGCAKLCSVFLIYILFLIFLHKTKHTVSHNAVLLIWTSIPVTWK